MHEKSGSRKELLEQMISEDPDNSFLWFAIAQEELKSGHDAQAESWFKKLITDAPDDIGTYYHYGQLLMQQKRYQESRKIIESGINKATSLNEQHAKGELQGLLFALEDE